MKCSMCDGTGKMNLTVSVWGSDEPDKESVLPCVVCGGSGEVSQEEADELQRENEAWCSCGNPSEDTKFYDNGEHAECYKHHWRCADCKKIVQIG